MSLREPFFLRGQQSRLVRAIGMSLALGGMGFVVGTAWFGGARATFAFLGTGRSDDYELAFFSGSAGMLLAAISILYAYWLRRHSLDTLLRAVWIPCLATAPWLTAPLLQPQLDEWSVFLDDSWNLPLDFLTLYGLLWFAWTTASVRPAAIWFLSAGLSFLSVPLTIVLLKSVEWIAVFYWSWIPGISLVDALELATVLTFGGQFFAALLIPWGIPFWRPPVAGEMPDDVPDLPAQAIAITARDPHEA
jgi:hypothetical protein